MRTIAVILFFAVVLGCQGSQSALPTPVPPTQDSSKEVVLAGIGITVKVPERYSVLGEFSQADFAVARVGDINTVMTMNVFRRELLTAYLYGPGSSAPWSIGTRDLNEALDAAKEKYAADRIRLDLATLTSIGGRDGILIRTEWPALTGSSFAQEAYVVTDRGVVEIISQIDLEFISLDMQRSTFDTILDSVQFQSSQDP